jgi:ketosteroid isomerase-like protein
VSGAAAWVSRYGDAWRAGDAAAAAALFAPGASYTSDLFGPGLRGREEIAAYWTQATGGQENLDLRLGSPIVSGDRAAVEWRASFVRGGRPVELAACLVLRFDAAGLCLELREYWRERPPA